MARSNQSNHQNKTINTQKDSALRSQQVQELEDYINITYGILDNILQILDTENVPVMQIIPYLAILSKKLKVILPTLSKKPDDFMRKTKNYFKKTPNDIEKLHRDFLEEGKEERPVGHLGVFYQNLGITACTLENYSNFESNFSFNNGSILEIHDYFRTRGNVSFNDLFQLINTLASQDFVELNKFRLKESLGKMKEMDAHLVKTNKTNRNESNLSKFFSSPFPPVMPKPMPMGNILLPLAARENASVTLREKRVFTGK